MTAPAPSSDERLLERNRRAAIRGLVVQRLAKGFSERTAFVLSIVIAAGFGGWMLALSWMSPVDLAEPLLVRGVRWVCVVAGGLVTLGLAADLTAREGSDGMTALLQQRGYDARAMRHAHLYASVRLIAGTLGPSTAFLAILAVALSRSSEALLARLVLTLGLISYVLLLSGVLALCARWAVAIDRKRPRWVLIALMIGPEIARGSGLEVPAIPSLLGGLLSQVATLGVGSG